MNIIYIISSLLIIIFHILIQKNEEKESFFKWSFISIILFLCYNIFICVMMSFIKIQITLLNLSIINIFTTILLIFKLIKSKKIQKYYFSLMDIIAIIVMLIITIVIAIKLYGIPLNLYNFITDGAVHYFVADEFYENSSLLEKSDEVFNFWSLSTFMPGAYINTGIIFKIFSGVINEIYFCKLYLIFNLGLLFLSGILMYFLLCKNKENEKDKILPFIFALIYMMGYPLNSVISGFSYLSLALNIIITIIMSYQLKINNYYRYILIFLLNFGLYFSYYYFVPVIYIAIFLQIIIEIKNNKQKIITKDNIINIMYTLLIPGLFGLLFFQIIPFIDTLNNPIEITKGILGIEGVIYSNFITNILIFLLLSIYILICNIKNKKLKIIDYMFILNILFLGILFLGLKNNIVSSYYYYKVYYLFWIILINLAFNTIERLLEKGKIIKIIVLGFVTLYFVGIIISIIINTDLIFFDIYKENIAIVKEEHKIVYDKELEIISYYNQNININNMEDNKTYFCLSPWEQARTFWIYALTKNPFVYIDVSYGEYSYDLNNFIESEDKYAVILKEDYLGNFNEIDNEIEKNNFKILFRNEMGIILEKN